MDKIKVFSRIIRSDGYRTCKVTPFETVDEANRFVEQEPGQRFVTIGDQEFQRALQYMGAERG